jgi:hypothetical protein
VYRRTAISVPVVLSLMEAGSRRAFGMGGLARDADAPKAVCGCFREKLAFPTDPSEKRYATCARARGSQAGVLREFLVPQPLALGACPRVRAGFDPCDPWGRAVREGPPLVPRVTLLSGACEGGPSTVA